MGKVRCSKCRHTFHLALHSAESASSAEEWAEQAPAASDQLEIGESPQPPGTAANPESDAAEQSHSNIVKASILPPYDSHFDQTVLDSESPEVIARLLRDAVLNIRPGEHSFDEFLETHSLPKYSDNIEDNIHSELTIDMEEDLPHSGSSTQDPGSETRSAEITQTELELPGIEDSYENTAPPAGQSATTAATADQELIAEVDQLIGNKLLGQESKNHPESTSGDEPLLIIDKPRSSAVSRWLFTPLLGLAAILLLAGAAYQLWLRQALPLLDDETIPRWTTPVVGPLAEQIAEKLGVGLPVRRDLAKLQLLSARTEAHPTRPSTILLRLSVINHSQIPQPFPWLELSLTDKDGRLVSRRALSPEDYLHNNRLENKINANELQAITIELLAFPKQATGYELILLNK